MTDAVTQTFIPGPRLIDGSDLTTAFDQVNAAFALISAFPDITALNTVGAGTITAAGILSGTTGRGGTQSGSAFTDTTATAAQIISAMGSGAAVGSAFYWTYQNNTDADATIAAGSGVTLSGNVVVPKLTWTKYLVTKASSSAVTIEQIGSGQMTALPVSKYGTDNAANSTLTMGGLVGAQLCNVRLSNATPGTLYVGPLSAVTAAQPDLRSGATWQVTIANPANSTAQLSGLTGTSLSNFGKLQPGTAQTAQVSYNLTTVAFTGLTSTSLPS